MILKGIQGPGGERYMYTTPLLCNLWYAIIDKVTVCSVMKRVKRDTLCSSVREV
jgi:hypothetical protein